MATCTLVVVSGPGREAGLDRALRSVFLRSGGALCDDGVVGWDGDVPPPDLHGRWEPFRVRFVPEIRWREAHRFAEAQAVGDRWVLWLLDDEVVVPDGDPLHREIALRYGQEYAPPPTPLSIGLVGELPPDNAFGVGVVFPSAIASEPRLLGSGWSWPQWACPSVRVVGWDSLWQRIPIVRGLVLARAKFKAPAGAPLRLNIGAGNRWSSGWTNIDHDEADAPDVKLDVGEKALPYPAGSVSALYCSHMIDHLDLRRGLFFLRECFRVLAPGAPIRLTCCDLAVFIRGYQEGTLARFAYMQPVEYQQFQEPGVLFGIIGCGALSDRPWYSGHRQLYDGPGLCEVLEHVGFVQAGVYESDEQSPEFWDTDLPFPDHTATVEALKP